MKSNVTMNSIGRRMALLLAAGAFTTVWTGCEKDYTYVAPPVTAPVSLATDIQPIFSDDCSMSGCHDGVTEDLDLTTGNSRQSLIDQGDLDLGNPTNSILYKRITKQPGQSGFMPDGGSPLPGGDINLILKWIQDGALDN